MTRHTELTTRNFAGFAWVVLLISCVSVGFGAVDLLMVTPKGLLHVAAVGQGELIVSGVFAFFVGVVDIFTARLAVAEGENARAHRLPVLVWALLPLLGLCEVLGLLVGAGVEPFLRLTGQQPELVPLVGDYVQVRAWSTAAVLAYIVIGETLKICGMKNASFLILGAGLGVNVLLNWVFLYTSAASLFASPASAVSAATVGAQILMACAGLGYFLRQNRRPDAPADVPAAARPARDEVLAEFRSMLRTAPGVGARHFNDYAGAIVPSLFIGTLGIQAVAAAGVATKIYTLFCRVPQACASGAFAFYGYAVGARDTALPAVARRLLVYTAVPTAVAAGVLLLYSPQTVGVFASAGMDQDLARDLLLAFLLPLPVYVLSAVHGEMLTVHQRGGLLFGASTLTTYLLTIPLAWYAVFVLDSPFLAIACNGVSTAVLAFVFHRALRRDHWAAPREVAHV
ncbi:integral membrane protein [Streptomyces albus]|uniref:Probable multidrug resistance protein NorM n=1 Tax=Streptomyces albus (strain ATCC 21838 / DSM 41398 / FERM P-419 / JCM 4703 / NBRC 107858) TaxID=1081613 RepID=A0A0B5F7D1_STRA4|nr:integral membrane protein [Streptomyces albus]AOU81789.1 integral membrane protein [Streptomyces albus]AYN37476.1 MATE family efflux transporter [Streptomyces albus]